MMDPDHRIQDAIRTMFRLFERLGSARQVLLHMRREGLSFPRPADGKSMAKLAWRAPAYRNVVSVLQNPFYAGAYAYGKSRVQTELVDGSPRKVYGRSRPMEEWTALLREHHEGYVTWERYEEIQRQLARNSFRKRSGEAKSARGGQALLSGLLRCRRCGRMLRVGYGGSGIPMPRYSCRQGEVMYAVRCGITFSAARPDAAVAREILLAIEPVGVKAALMAAEDASKQVDERCRARELELQQAQYDVKLAARRYESVDPDKRLVASELEARWEAALCRMHDCEARLLAESTTRPAPVEKGELLSLAQDLHAAWESPGTQMRTKQQLVRTLIEEIVVDVDDEGRNVVLLIHWRGGVHSELRVRKPATGEHTKRTSSDADRVIRDMATRWSDTDVASTLNRMGLTTGQGNTWNSRRVGSYRRKHGVHGYESAVKDGECLTMLETARRLGVTCHVVRRLIQEEVLPARQVVPDAPWQILAADLERPDVQHALRRRSRRGRPCRNSRDNRTLEIPALSQEEHNER